MKAYKEMMKTVKKNKPKVDLRLTNWVSIIRSAEIVMLEESEDFKNSSENVIQVKRMREFESEEYAIMEKPQHYFDRALDVIKLPLQLPCTVHDRGQLPDYLFLRPDEYELFAKLNGDHKDIVLNGSSGISRSWFHWKFILFCYRLDLYQLVYGNKQLWTEKQMQLGNRGEEMDVVNTVELHIPKFIIQTYGGRRSYMFFVDQPEKEVLHLDSNNVDLNDFESEDLTILWKFNSDYRNVELRNYKSRVIATMPSSKLYGYDYFYRHGARMFYMPCPSELQLQWMSKIVNEYSSYSKYKASVSKIHERIEKYGPCMRTVLFSFDDYGYSLANYRESEEYTAKKHPYIIDSLVHLSKEYACLTEYGVQYVVDRDHCNAYQFPSMNYKINSIAIRNTHQDYVQVLPLPQLQQRLLEPEESHRNDWHVEGDEPRYGMDDCYNTNLSVLFSTFSKNLCWKSRLLTHPHQTPTKQWHDFNVQLRYVKNAEVPYQDMHEGTLYHPDSLDFPLVHFYYLQDARLVGILANTSTKLSRSVYTYLDFYQALEISPNEIPLDLYYLTPPLRKEFYDTMDHFSPPAFFIEADDRFQVCDESDKVSYLRKFISFSILVPPENFASSY